MNQSGRINNAFVIDETEARNDVHETKPQQIKLEIIESNKKANEKEPYDPYKHRVVERPTTNTDTMIHLLKGSLGTGILSMPKAFDNSGWLVGTIGTIFIGAICTYCIHILLKSHYELCKRKKVPSLTYPEIVKAAILEGPNWLKWLSSSIINITNAFLLIYQLGTCCIYVVFVATNIKSIADYHFGYETDVRLYMLIILLPLVLINWVRNLKFLAPFSSVANAVTIVSFGIILYYILREPISLEGREAAGRIGAFPLFFGTVLFALEAIGVIMPLENEMRTPKAFGGSTGVLNRSMIFIIFLYVMMGLFGYLNYGSDTKETITLNLPNADWLAQAVKAMLAFGIFITHGLANYVAIDITWNQYVIKWVGDSSKSLVWEFVVRTILVLITFALAVAIPNLDLFIALFGALCLSVLGLVFPAMIEHCTFHNERKGFYKVLMILKNLFIIIVGVAGLIVGTTTSLTELAKRFSGEH